MAIVFLPARIDRQQLELAARRSAASLEGGDGDPIRRRPRPSSTPASSAEPISAISADDCRGEESECERVIVVKSPKRTFNVTVRPTTPALRSRPPTESDKRTSSLWQGIEVVPVRGEGLLVTDRLDGPLCHHRTRVLRPCKPVELSPRRPTDETDQRSLVEKGQISDCANPVAPEPFVVRGPTPHRSDTERG